MIYFILFYFQITNIAAGLTEKEWFHGVLPREEVVRLLVNDGDFLVRETMRHEERQVIIIIIRINMFNLFPDRLVICSYIYNIISTLHH